MRQDVAQSLAQLVAHSARRDLLRLLGTFVLSDAEDEERRAQEAEGVERDRRRRLQHVDDHAREPGTAELRCAAADLQLRIPIDQLLPLDERWKVRLIGDVEEDGGDADEEADAVQLPDRQRVEGVRNRNRAEQQRARKITDDEDRPAPKPVDPHARREADEKEGQELDCREGSYLERARVQHVDRGERQRELRELRPELADRLGRPELDEVRMSPKASGRPELHACSLSARFCLAGARSIRTSPETVLANTSTSGASSARGAAGASESSNSELVEPLTVFASMKTREPRRIPTPMSP